MVNRMTSMGTLHYLDKRSDMKKLLVVCLILLIGGCYVQSPAKILKHPSLYSIPLIVDTDWDGELPVRTWVFKTEYGTEIVDFQGRVWRIERDPFDTNSVMIIHDILE